MNCMKCGRDIPLGQVFCKECLADMEKYPVKPGTPVLIPVHEPAAPSRRSGHARKSKKPEEQIARLRRLVKFQTLALIAVLIAFGVTIAIMVNQISEMTDATLPGQNYSTNEEAPTEN